MGLACVRRAWLPRALASNAGAGDAGNPALSAKPPAPTRWSRSRTETSLHKCLITKCNDFGVRAISRLFALTPKCGNPKCALRVWRAFLDARTNLLAQLGRILMLVHGDRVLACGVDDLVDRVRRDRDRALGVAREQPAIDVLASHVQPPSGGRPVGIRAPAAPRHPRQSSRNGAPATSSLQPRRRDGVCGGNAPGAWTRTPAACRGQP